MSEHMPVAGAFDVTDEALLPRRFDGLVRKVDDIDDTAKRLLSALDKVAESLREVLHQQASLFDCMGRMDGRLDVLASELRQTKTEIDRRVTALEQSTADLARRVDALVPVPAPRRRAKTKRR